MFQLMICTCYMTNTFLREAAKNIYRGWTFNLTPLNCLAKVEYHPKNAATADILIAQYLTHFFVFNLIIYHLTLVHHLD